MSAATLTAAEADEFRQRCREFLTANATGIKIDEADPRGARMLEANKVFQQQLADAGLAGLTYDSAYGGAGLTKDHDRIWREVYGDFPNMTSQLTISHGMCLPILNEFGSDEQKAAFMADNIAGRTVWCQMFSEPGAGSDVASLQTRAELDGEEWTLNGQKVWTTLAHVSDYGIVLARTDPEQPKHRGISMFIVDMSDPSIEVRAIHQIDGGQHFNEVFFTNTRIPQSWLVGDRNDGWRLATAMLMYERVTIGTGATSGVSQPTTKRLIEQAQRNGKIADPAIRQDLMRMYCEETAKSLVSMRTRSELKAGKTPGPGGSLGKLHSAKISRALRKLAPQVVGPATGAWEDGDKVATWSQQVLGSFSASIAGGTDEIQKNIIGDRVLGLPREPSVDKDVPFNTLKVGTQNED